jgi:hypothetical protein
LCFLPLEPIPESFFFFFLFQIRFNTFEWTSHCYHPIASSQTVGTNVCTITPGLFLRRVNFSDWPWADIFLSLLPAYLGLQTCATMSSSSFHLLNNIFCDFHTLNFNNILPHLISSVYLSPPNIHSILIFSTFLFIASSSKWELTKISWVLSMTVSLNLEKCLVGPQ